MSDAQDRPALDATAVQVDTAKPERTVQVDMTTILDHLTADTTRRSAKAKVPAAHKERVDRVTKLARELKKELDELARVQHDEPTTS